MKVLHLLGAAEDTGGILTVLRNLQAVMASAGTEHVLWVNAAYRESRRPSLSCRHTRHLLAESDRHLTLLYRAVRSLGELRRLLAIEPFDVLHGHTRGALPVAIAVATLWRQPVLFSNHAYARRKALYRWAARRSRLRMSVLTPNMARHFGLSVGTPGVAVVSECCADRLFDLPASQGVTAPDQPLRLVGLGNIVRWKNWHLLLEAIRGLPPGEQARIRFDHWGPVPADPDCQAYDRELRDTIGRHGLARRCRFHGLSLAIEETLRTADAFVLPSTNESCSVALIEALALGVPAIASASGGNIDIIDPGRTGLLFAPDDPASLRECLRRLVCRQTAFAAPAGIRDSVRGRSATAVAAQYAALYEMVRLGRHATPVGRPGGAVGGRGRA